MRLEDTGGRYLLLNLLGYQYPRSRNRDDANWLRVAIELHSSEGTFNTEVPFLKTSEAASLALWLDGLARGDRMPAREDYLEPSLAVWHERTRDDLMDLTFVLRGELAPPWSLTPDEYRFPLTVPREQLSAAADSLQADLQWCPPRLGYQRRPPFIPLSLLDTFVIAWDLVVPAHSPTQAERLAREWAAWIELRAQLEPVEVLLDGFRARFITPLPVPANDPPAAVLRLLFHLPQAYGAPRLGPPVHSPAGDFTLLGEIVPDASPSADAPDLSTVRGRFALTNVAGVDPFEALGVLFPK